MEMIIVVVTWLAAANLVFVAADAHNSSPSLREREALFSTRWWGNQIPIDNISESHCVWMGIDCNKKERVTSIGLYIMNINDELTKLNFFFFTELEGLHLIGCGLNGSIPYQIGMLSKLNYLSLYRNSLTGNLPSSLSNLTQLTYLDLSYNHLSGSIPYQIGMLSKLNYLSLSYNDLRGNLPSSLSNLTQLTYLILSYNLLNGSIPYQIGMLSKLNYLSLLGNSLTGNLPSSLSNLTQLTHLYLSYNRLNGSIPYQIGMLSKLKMLNLTNNSLTGNLPSSLSNLTQLIYLDLSYNNLSGSIPVELHNLSRLYFFDYSHNNIIGTIPENQLKDNLPRHNKEQILDVLYIVLPITIGPPILILAFFLCRQRTLKKSQNRTSGGNGDLCSLWNYDGKIGYEDIIKSTNNFDIKYCIGTGGYGSVYEARLPSGQTVALKKLHRQEAEEPAFDRSFRNEV